MVATSSRLLIALVLLSTATLTVACHVEPEVIPKPEATCEGLVKKAELCKSRFPDGTDAASLLNSCKQDLDAHPEEQNALLKCVSSESCQDAERCIKDASRAVALARATSAVEAGIAGDLTSIIEHPQFNVCIAAVQGEGDASKLSKSFADACKKLLGAAAKMQHELYTAARDKGEPAELSECQEEYRNLVAFSGNDTTNADRLCNEIGQMNGIRRGKRLAKANADKKTLQIPFECLYHPDKLAEINTDWSKAQRSELISACYLELGTAILASRSDKAIEDDCGDVQQKVFSVYNAEKLQGKNAALDAEITRYKNKSKCTP